MAKRFRLKIWRAFQSCRSKETSAVPTGPVPLFCRLSPVNAKPPPVPSSESHYSSLKRHVSAFVSVGCGTRSKATHSDDECNAAAPEFHWAKDDKWHVVAKVDDETPRRKIYTSGCSEDDDVVFPPPPPPSAEKKKRRVKKKKTTCRLRISTSSADSGIFSSDGYDDEETETLVSSRRSFSTESSTEYFNPHQLETIREVAAADWAARGKKSRRKKRPKRRVSKKKESESVFEKLMGCGVEGKVRESFAVVKRSEDPYVDFKRSMMEMILEKQMFDYKDLEQLLHCFLSLNSTQHHPIIVQAFSEIWETLFCTLPSCRRVSR